MLFRLWVKDSLSFLLIKVFNLCRKAPCQMTSNFYVNMAILEGLVEVEGFDFDEHDVILCFALKGSTNKFCSLMKRTYMKNLCIFTTRFTM